MLIYREELLTSILCTKSKYEGETFGIMLDKLIDIENAFIEEVKNRGIDAVKTCYLPFNHFGYLHGCIFVYEGVTLEELVNNYKNSSRSQEITDLIWDEELICKVANINHSKGKKLKK